MPKVISMQDGGYGTIMTYRQPYDVIGRNKGIQYGGKCRDVIKATNRILIIIIN